MTDTYFENSKTTLSDSAKKALTEKFPTKTSYNIFTTGSEKYQIGQIVFNHEDIKIISVDTTAQTVVCEINVEITHPDAKKDVVAKKDSRIRFIMEEAPLWNITRYTFVDTDWPNGVNVKLSQTIAGRISGLFKTGGGKSRRRNNNKKSKSKKGGRKTRRNK
jgi:hypothetical protein